MRIDSVERHTQSTFDGLPKRRAAHAALGVEL
jgi:hypothetical protein